MVQWPVWACSEQKDLEHGTADDTAPAPSVDLIEGVAVGITRAQIERLAEACHGVEIDAWEETDDPFAAVAKRLAGGGTWAFEPTTAYHDAARIEAGLAL